MSYNCKRTLILCLIFGVFLIFFWYIQNHIFLSSKSKDILLDMNGSDQGFNSLRAYSIYYILFYLLFLNLRLNKETPSLIIAHHSRTQLFVRRTLSILISACLVGIELSIVNILLTLLFIPDKIISNPQFYLITLFNFLGITAFYWWIGLLCKGIEDLTSSFNIAVSITFILIGLCYFFIKSVPWLPIDDLRIYDSFLTRQWDIKDFLLILARQVGLVVVFYILGHIVYKEKDFIKNDN